MNRNGTVYLTEEEYNKFTVSNGERDETFYIPRSVNVEDVGSVRPVITTEYLSETHFLLIHQEDKYSDRSEEYARFEHYKEGYEQRERLNIEIIDEWDTTITDAAISELRKSGRSDEEIAAIFTEVKRQLLSNQ